MTITLALVNFVPSGSKFGKKVRGLATLDDIIDDTCDQILEVFMTSEKGKFPCRKLDLHARHHEAD
ncbi:hypothetical protein [Methylobacterium sp.]|uniref:hypothetical protein n=1 Tax=Methylobacterium sp. TaxID=409 RepID=UPI003B58DA34